MHLGIQVGTRSLRGLRITAYSLRLRAAPSRLPMSGMATAAQNAYIDPQLEVSGAQDGPLKGLTFAVKDMYDVAGQVTGFGNPAWKTTHHPAKSNAVAVQALLEAGAAIRGKTHMDELAYSLNGENKHYGTPVNPTCPDRVPGGSSSGSAVAVAAGDVDFGLGSDTGGSIRVPASYCGLLGMRPTHGRVSLEGARPLAPSFDTGGWLARDAQLLRKVGEVLLKQPSKQFVFKRWLVGTDAWDLCMGLTKEAILKGRLSEKPEIERLFGSSSEVTVADPSAELGSLKDWFHVFRIVQAAEAWKALGGWISNSKPEFGPGVKERFEAAANITPQQEAEMVEKRARIINHLDALLGNDGILLVPAAPGPAPKLNTPPQELDGFRSRLISLTCISGLGKLPQISIPCATIDGCPVGIGIIGPRGSDEALLEAAEKLERLLKS